MLVPYTCMCARVVNVPCGEGTCHVDKSYIHVVLRYTIDLDTEGTNRMVGIVGVYTINHTYLCTHLYGTRYYIHTTCLPATG